MDSSLKENDFTKAIEYCVELQDMDVANQRKWSERLQSIKLRQETFLAQAAQFEELIIKIDDSDFKEDWESVVKYCNEALRLRKDESIKRKLERAKERLEKEKLKEKYKQSINEVKALMTDRKWDEAKDILKELQLNYPNHKDEIRHLFARVFDAETTNTLRPRNVEQGSSNNSTKGSIIQRDEDFFGLPSTEKKIIANGEKANITSDDFFDSDNIMKRQKKDKKVNKKDDFDF